MFCVDVVMCTVGSGTVGVGVAGATSGLGRLGEYHEENATLE